MINKISNIRFWSGVVFLLVLIVALVQFSVWVYTWLQDEQRMPVQIIDFSGDHRYTNILRLEKLIRQSQKGSFFALNVSEVHVLLEQQPWIYRASVRKQWPNTLKVYLVEQVPVAKWNNDFLLNAYGETFNGEMYASNKLPRLPQLFGPGGSEKTALEGFGAMQTLLTNSAMGIGELSLSERFAWQVELNNGIKLNLGRKEFIDRLQRFVDLYPLLKKQNQPIEYVDLRYDTGLAVGWKSLESNTQS